MSSPRFAWRRRRRRQPRDFNYFILDHLRNCHRRQKNESVLNYAVETGKAGICDFLLRNGASMDLLAGVSFARDNVFRTKMTKTFFRSAVSRPELIRSCAPEQSSLLDNASLGCVGREQGSVSTFHRARGRLGRLGFRECLNNACDINSPWSAFCLINFPFCAFKQSQNYIKHKVFS